MNSRPGNLQATVRCRFESGDRQRILLDVISARSISASSAHPR